MVFKVVIKDWKLLKKALIVRYNCYPSIYILSWSNGGYRTVVEIYLLRAIERFIELLLTIVIIKNFSIGWTLF